MRGLIVRGSFLVPKQLSVKADVNGKYRPLGRYLRGDVVEAAGVEPASANLLILVLHA